MSRHYSMSIEIEGIVPERQAEIENDANCIWSFEDWVLHNGLLCAYGDSSLCGGETEEEFTDRLAKAIWQANKAYCQVTVTATYLEDLPCEEHLRDEDDYAQWQKGKS